MALTQIKPAGLSKPIDLGDNEKLRLGASNDLELYYDGTDTRIQHVGFSGQLELYANNFEIAKQTNASKYIRGNNGVLELYYDNNKKLETTSSGVSITGGITADGASEFTANVKFDGATAGRDITFLRSSNTLRFQDNTILSLGDGDDFKMFHNGTITRFVHDLAGANLEFQSDNFVFKDKDNGDVMMKLLHDGAVELYHDGSKKFETTSIGASITGNLSFPDNGYAMFGAGNDLQIYHSGTDTFFKNQTGSLNFFNSGVTQFRNAADNESLLKMTSDGDVELYYDGVKKFETTSGGVEVFGVLQMDDGNSHIKLIDGARIDIGSSADLQIFHSGGENFIRGNASASTLFIDCCNELQIRHLDTNGQNSEKMIVCNDDGAVELYHDNSKKLETISGGITVTGGINTSAASTFSTSTFSSTTTFQDSLLIGDNVLAKFGTGSDFRIYHDGTDNRFDSSGLKNFIFRPKDTDIGLKILGDGAVEAYFDGNKKFETLTDGVNITGTLKVNGSAFSAGGGKVVQQVSVVKTDTASNSTGSQSTWEFNDSSLRVQITGSSTNNKFMFIGQVTTGGEISTHIGLRDGETSSNVTGMMATGTGNTRASTSGHDHGDSHSASTVPIIGVISVPDTNQHTYYFQFSHTSGGTVTLYINRGSNSGDNAERGRYISSLTVLEIEP